MPEMFSRTVKANAKRNVAGLTVAKATADARRIVNRVMPNVGATVDSRISADPITLDSVVITTVTFPANVSARDIADMDDELHTLSGWSGSRSASSSIVITRKR